MCSCEEAGTNDLASQILKALAGVGPGSWAAMNVKPDVE